MPGDSGGFPSLVRPADDPQVGCPTTWPGRSAHLSSCTSHPSKGTLLRLSRILGRIAILPTTAAVVMAGVSTASATPPAPCVVPIGTPTTVQPVTAPYSASDGAH